eukprot:m.203315 g.203315  ORF g.203315 m.203315 type:complete len:416 (+) comp39621_c2_seq5:1807-3054(+)
MQLFEDHCIGQTNVIYERYVFNSRGQGENEAFEKYYLSLKELVQRCNYREMSGEFLRDRIVNGIRDDGLRKQLLQKRDLILAKCEDMCRASKAAAKQLKDMGREETVHAVEKTGKPPTRKTSQTEGGPEKKWTSWKPKGDNPRLGCPNCGKNHPRGKEHCPAENEECYECGKIGHYGRVCRGASSKGKTPQRRSSQRQGDFARYVEIYDDDEDAEWLTNVVTLEPCENVNAVGDLNEYLKQVFATMEVEGKPVRFQLDTGSTCNIVRECDLPTGIRVQPTEQMLSLYSNAKMKPLGKCRLKLRNPKVKKMYEGDFVVVKDTPTAILGARSVQQMGLITVDYQRIHVIDNPPDVAMTPPDAVVTSSVNVTGKSKSELAEQYPVLFSRGFRRVSGTFDVLGDSCICQYPLQSITTRR